ncbi:MAG: C-GCAxxG-C-C family protein [Anaerolineales bacterium]
MDRAEIAVDTMRSGFNCAQSMVKAYAAELNADEAAVVRMVAPFGGGMGRNGYVCGAVSGAVMVIGARFGNADAADTAARDRAYAAVSKLLEKFRAEHHTVLCRELISFEINNPEGYQRAREAGVFQNRCPLFLRSVGKILDEILSSAD